MGIPLYLIFLTIILLSVTVVGKTMYNRKKVTCMTGMMIAMTLGMIVGLIMGVVFGILFLVNFFLATILVLLVGMFLCFFLCICFCFGSYCCLIYVCCLCYFIYRYLFCSNVIRHGVWNGDWFFVGYPCKCYGSTGRAAFWAYGRNDGGNAWSNARARISRGNR